MSDAEQFLLYHLSTGLIEIVSTSPFEAADRPHHGCVKFAGAGPVEAGGIFDPQTHTIRKATDSDRHSHAASRLAESNPKPFSLIVTVEDAEAAMDLSAPFFIERPQFEITPRDTWYPDWLAPIGQDVATHRMCWYGNLQQDLYAAWTDYWSKHSRESAPSWAWQHHIPGTNKQQFVKSLGLAIIKGR